MSFDTLSLDNPAFTAYLFYAGVLCLKVVLMAPLTGLCRLSRGAFVNPEDATTFGTKVPKTDPEVERVRRAHQNDIENIPIFLVLAFLFLYTNPSLFFAKMLFRIYTGGRILHTILYLRSSPIRPLSFFITTAVSVYMTACVIYTFH